MKEIRAFVGHSFSEDDAEVVNSFLRYFDQLSNLLPNFSWEHAEDAEPKVVAEKVMSLIGNKNVFIGICTKKECVLQSGSIKKSIFYPGQFLFRESECSWKTSDWIIQELGLAKGRDLDIILLIESGVRKPGGLQSDLEYIEFDRSAPDKSFGKIVEMLTALSPKKHITSAIATDAQSADNERNEPEPPKNDNWGTPRPKWMRCDYEYAFFEMVITDNQSGADNINSAYLATKDASNEDNKNVWAAYCEFIRLRWGKGGSLANLKALAELYPDSSRVWKYLAMGFEKYHDYRGVAHAYETAAIKTKDEIEQLRLLGRSAIAYTRLGAEDVATEIINRMKAQVQESGAGEVEMISVLKEISEIKNDDEVLLAIMERMMDLDPSDTKTRFSLAYKHSSIGNDDLALFHYLQIPFDERDSMTWNNLGVAFDRFDLSAKSILAYRKAEGLGETLAMSNLASKLITAGFLSQAEQICRDALEVENYHKNITHTMARLKDKPDEENKKEADLLEKTKPISDFYTEFGRTLSLAEPSDLAKCWQGPNCILDVTLQGSIFEAVGFYEVPTSGLLGSVFPGVSGSISKAQTGRFQVNYHGSLRGRAIEARVIRRREGEGQKGNSLLSSNEIEVRVLMTLSDDGNEFRVMEKTQGTSPRFYTLKRKASI